MCVNKDTVFNVCTMHTSMEFRSTEKMGEYGRVGGSKKISNPQTLLWMSQNCYEGFRLNSSKCNHLR